MRGSAVLLCKGIMRCHYPAGIKVPATVLYMFAFRRNAWMQWYHKTAKRSMRSEA